MEKKHILYLIFCITLLIVGNSPLIAEEVSIKSNLLYITGNAQYSVSPDIGELVLGIEADGMKAGDAQNKVSSILSSFIGQLKDIGIKDNEIKTIENSLNPIRDYSTKKPPYKIISYTALQKIRIRIEGENRLNLISKAIDLAAVNSINHINSVSFGISPELQNQINGKVFALASEQALNTGKEVLKKLGLKMVGIKEIRLGGGGFNRAYSQPQVMYAKSAVADSAVPEITNIMSGEQMIERQADLIIEFSN